MALTPEEIAQIVAKSREDLNEGYVKRNGHISYDIPKSEYEEEIIIPKPVLHEAGGRPAHMDASYRGCNFRRKSLNRNRNGKC